MYWALIFCAFFYPLFAPHMPPASSQINHDATGWSRARGLPAPNEYANQHVYGNHVQYPSTSLSGPISYYGFSGMGLPPNSLGQPGDIYVDVNPQAPELYAHDVNLEWRPWSGPDVMHAHPTSDDWCLWAFADHFGWFSPKNVKLIESHADTSEKITWLHKHCSATIHNSV